MKNEQDKELLKLQAIDEQIQAGLDKDELKKIRRKLYRIKNEELSIDELFLKQLLLECIKEMLET